MPRKSSGIYQTEAGTWTVDKVHRGHRLRYSAAEDYGAAEAWLIDALAKLNHQAQLGRVRHTFEQAATHYISTYPDKPSLDSEMAWLEELMPFIGDLPLDRIYDATLKPFIEAQRKKPLAGGRIGCKSKTINLKLGLVRHILQLASRSWRDDEGNTVGAGRAAHHDGARRRRAAAAAAHVAGTARAPQQAA